MKKILKGLVKYVTLTVLLVCFLPLSLHHVKADEVEYSLPSYVGHLSIHDDGNATFTQEVTYDFDSDYKSILDQELLEAEKRLMDRPSYREVYEEKIVYEHDVAPAEVKNRFGLADM